MTYDMAGSWDPMVGHHTNLYSAPGDTGNLVAHVVVSDLDPMVRHYTNLYSAPGDTGNLVAHVVISLGSNGQTSY